MTKIPLYIQLINNYRQKILNAELKPGAKLPSEIEMCRKYNISRITVKRALDELEREGLINKVKGSGSFVAKSPGPNRVSGQKNVFGLLLPFPSGLGRGIDLISGASSYFSENSSLLSVLIAEFDTNKEKECLQNFIDHGTNGILFYPYMDMSNLTMLNKLILDGFPVVLIDKQNESLPLSSVASDNLNGSYQAVSYLSDRGHKNIAFVSDVNLENYSTVRQRYFGYCMALKDQGLEINDENSLIGYASEIISKIENSRDIMIHKLPTSQAYLDYHKEKLYRLLDRQTPITAIHAVNDYIAIDFMKAALDMGLKIPADLSFIGFDNIQTCNVFEVPLTTVEQDMFKIGFEAARLLASLSETPIADRKISHITLPTRIIERSSVADLPASTSS